MLHINNLSKSFNSRFVLKNVTYNFPSSGIIALIGVNGAGKSTLLNILCNLDEPDLGSVSKPKAARIGYLPQDPSPYPLDTILSECMGGRKELYNIKLEMDQITETMATDYTDEKYERFERLEHLYRSMNGYSFEDDTMKLLIGLGFKEDQMIDHPSTLSGGWRMRLELGKLLNDSPDFIIMDEPTNHLDLPAIIWLEEYLHKYRGTVLFVSHDESLLNRLPNRILHLKNASLTEYYGNYDEFLEQYELREAGKIAELKMLSNKIQSMQRFVDRFKAKPSKAAQARSRMKMIAKLERETSGIVLDDADSEIRVRIPLTQKSGKDIVHLDNCMIGYGAPLLKNVSLFVSRGNKIAIIGTNGLGKSTLIKTIIGKLPLLSGEIRLGHNVKIGYYAQDQQESLDPNKSALENLKETAPKMTEMAMRSLLGAFLFRGDDIHKKASILSGGEKSRLSLAILLACDANFLLLDEPTNHLDMLSIEVLSDALVHYQGTVMFVSHNRTFINSVATHILEVMSGGRCILNPIDTGL